MLLGPLSCCPSPHPSCYIILPIKWINLWKPPSSSPDQLSPKHVCLIIPEPRKQTALGLVDPLTNDGRSTMWLAQAPPAGQPQCFNRVKAFQHLPIWWGPDAVGSWGFNGARLFCLRYLHYYHFVPIDTDYVSKDRFCAVSSHLPMLRDNRANTRWFVGVRLRALCHAINPFMKTYLMRTFFPPLIWWPLWVIIHHVSLFAQAIRKLRGKFVLHPNIYIVFSWILIDLYFSFSFL